jgi:hypothetical protein
MKTKQAHTPERLGVPCTGMAWECARIEQQRDDLLQAAKSVREVLAVAMLKTNNQDIIALLDSHALTLSDIIAKAENK